EFGIDLAFQYVSLGSNGGSGVQLAAPVDARIGVLSRSPNMFEIRASLNWDSNLGAIAFAPGVNVLHVLKRGSGTRGLMRAPYVTGGVGLNILKFGSGASTETQFALGAGVGKRLPYGSAVFRPEGFIAYAFSSGAFQRSEIGLLLSFPNGGGTAVEGAYRMASGRLDLGFKVGFFDPPGPGSAVALAGVEARQRVITHTLDFPLDGAVILGVGGRFVSGASV